jgi:hypothetical protein
MSTKPDALLNLANAMAEDILNTPYDEILREAKKDYGDPRALANKFDQILERTTGIWNGARCRLRASTVVCPRFADQLT